MKSIVVMCFILLAGLAGNAVAQSCPGGTTQVANTPNQLDQLLTGNTLCAVRAPDSWQEFHQSGGALIDFKRGPADPVDPTETVGTWSTTNGANAVVTHNYGAGGVFSWLVCQVGATTTYTLVSSGASGTITGATFRAGQGACP